jgi:hypothetical protein
LGDNQQRAPGLAAALTSALFCDFRPRENRLAVFVAYSDESGVGDPGGEFLVAGYVAREDEWPWISSAWQERVLDGPPPIPYLHVNEIRGQEWRAQHHISVNDAEERISEAVLVMRSSGAVYAIASVTKRSDLTEIFSHDDFKRSKKKTVIGLDQPDYLCFIGYAAFVLGQIYKKHPEAEKVTFVVSRKKGITERINQFHEGMKQYLDPKLIPLVGELIPDSMELQLPLQAADLLCWHIQKYYAETVDTVDRARFDRLTHGTIGHGDIWKRKDLEDLAQRLRARIAGDSTPPTLSSHKTMPPGQTPEQKETDAINPRSLFEKPLLPLINADERGFSEEISLFSISVHPRLSAANLVF